MTAEAYPAITIWQPWATLIAEGAKRFEFRSWPAPKRLHGTRVAIHAGARKTRTNEVRELLWRLYGSDWRETGLDRDPAIKVLEQIVRSPSSLPLSSVVCLATLGLAAINDSDRDEHSNWGWPLSDVERLEPFVPARGAQGWWTWRAPT